MGKVLSKFTNGFPGTVTRENDYVIVALKNVGQTVIKPGDPVFLYSGVTSAILPRPRLLKACLKVSTRSAKLWTSSSRAALLFPAVRPARR